MLFRLFSLTICFFFLSGCYSLAIKENDASYRYFNLLGEPDNSKIEPFLDNLSGSDLQSVLYKTNNPFGLGVIALTIYMQKPELIDKLVKLGADVNQPGSNGLTALHIAVNMQDTKTLKLLLDTYDAQPALTRNQETLLHTAAKVTYNKSLKEIIKRYPKMVNEKDYLGNIPLYYAVKNKDITTIKALMKAKSDSHIKNLAGQSPEDYTIGMTYDNITPLLSMKTKTTKKAKKK